MQMNLVFPKSRIDEFFKKVWPDQKDSGLRIGQAFFNYMDLHKVLSADNRPALDKLYEMDGSKAMAFICEHMDSTH